VNLLGFDQAIFTSANAAAGIYSESDNEESESDVNDIGLSKSAPSASPKTPRILVPILNEDERSAKEDSGCKNTTNSNDPLDAEDTDEGVDDDGDQADAYEQLRAERDKTAQ